MQKKNKIKKVLISILALAFVVSPIDLDSINFLKINRVAGALEGEPYDWFQGMLAVHGDVTWTKDTPDLVFDCGVYVVNGATLTIEKGTTIEFKKGLESCYGGPGLFVNDGRVVANGAQDEKIKFVSDGESGYVLEFYDQGENQEDRTSFLRFVEIYGEEDDEVPQAFLNPFRFLVKTAYAGDSWPAVKIKSGNVHIENSYFKNENSFVQIENGEKYDQNHNPAGNYEPGVEIVNSNFEGEIAVRAEIECDEADVCPQRVLLRDNWYGSVMGAFRIW